MTDIALALHSQLCREGAGPSPSGTHALVEVGKHASARSTLMAQLQENEMVKKVPTHCLTHCACRRFLCATLLLGAMQLGRGQ